MKKQSAMIGIALLAVSLGVFLAAPGAGFIHAAEDKPITDEVLKIAGSYQDQCRLQQLPHGLSLILAVS